MAHAKARLAWDVTAPVLAMLYNANRGKGKALGWRDFHPCPPPPAHRDNGQPDARMSLKEIRTLMTGG